MGWGAGTGSEPWRDTMDNDHDEHEDEFFLDVPMHAVLEDSDVIVTGRTTRPLDTSNDGEASIEPTNGGSMPPQTADELLVIGPHDPTNPIDHPSASCLPSAFSSYHHGQHHPHASAEVSCAIQTEEYQHLITKAREEMLTLLETRLRVKCGEPTPKRHSNNTDTTRSMVDESNPQQAMEPLDSPSNSLLNPVFSSSVPFECPSSCAISQTVKILEQLLFQQSKQSLPIYQDLSTLDNRLRHLMTVLVRRRMLKTMGKQHKRRSRGTRSSDQYNHGPHSSIDGMEYTATTTTNKNMSRQPTTPTTTTSTFRSERARLLIQVLGVQKYQDIIHLIQEIQLVKVKKVATFCGSQGCRRQSSMTTTTSKAYDTNLPMAVRQLYFGTPLVECWEQYPLHRLPQLPWNQLQQQAQQNLLSFQLWEMKIDGGKYND